MTFLKAQGIRELVGKDDRPRYVEEEPEVYEKEELDSSSKRANAEERLWPQAGALSAIDSMTTSAPRPSRVGGLKATDRLGRKEPNSTPEKPPR